MIEIMAPAWLRTCSLFCILKYMSAPGILPLQLTHCERDNCTTRAWVLSCFVTGRSFCLFVSSYSALQNVLQLHCPQLLGLFTLHGGDFANVGLCVFWEETPSQIYYKNVGNIKHTQNVKSPFSFVSCAQNSNFCVWQNSIHWKQQNNETVQLQNCAV